MNGRLYDPLLRRFLNADENIQDVFNTQNYNKYGYVFNNPLMYNDPNGEFVWFVPIIAAVVSEFFTMYYTQTPFNGARFVGGLAMSYASAGIAGAIGDVFKIATVAESLGKWGTIAARTGAHALTQSIFSTVQGGNFWSGVLSGAFASVSGDLLGMATNNLGANNILRSDSFALFNGAVSGGVGSVLGGGNFWMGAGQGLVVTAFNYLAHLIETPEYNDKSMTKWARKTFEGVEGASEINVKTGQAPSDHVYKDDKIYGKDKYGNYTKHEWGYQDGKKLYISKHTYNQGMQWLYLVTGHDLLHYSLKLIFPKLTNTGYHHVTIFDWELKQLEAWGISEGDMLKQSSGNYNLFINKYPKAINEMTGKGWLWEKTGIKLIK